MKTIALFPILISIIFASCNSTQIISSWSAPSHPENAFDRVLVLGLIPKREIKEEVEYAMISQFAHERIVANSAGTVFGPNGFKGLSSDEVGAKLKKEGYTAIMLISLLDKEKTASYTPRSVYAAPRVVGYSRYYRRYITVYDYVERGGYYTTNTNYILQAEIYTVNDDELLYSGQTRSYDPNGARDLANSFSKSIVSELKNKKLITPKTK